MIIIGSNDMNEQERLEDLFDYKILDTPPEKELEELAEIASAICDTPISLISLVDEKRQWFKVNIGLDISETPRKDAFCQHALNTPKEVLVVDDPLNDERFKDNPFVLGDPHIRFYAGAPLETPKGNVLGTLCVIDNKPHDISEKQKNALQLLAKRVMYYLNTRKLLIQQSENIELSSLRLKRLTNLAPGTIYQLKMTSTGQMSFSFVSKGISNMHPSLDPELLKEHPEMFFKIMHPDDHMHVRKSIRESFLDPTIWSIEFRVVSDDGSISWQMGNARPEKKEDGSIIWYGTFCDITSRKEYEQALEQISYDISHVLRGPVCTILGLTSLIEKEKIDAKMLKEYSNDMQIVSKELDSFTKRLNETYHEKRMKIVGRNR